MAQPSDPFDPAIHARRPQVSSAACRARSPGSLPQTLLPLPQTCPVPLGKSLLLEVSQAAFTAAWLNLAVVGQAWPSPPIPSTSDTERKAGKEGRRGLCQGDVAGDGPASRGGLHQGCALPARSARDAGLHPRARGGVSPVRAAQRSAASPPLGAQPPRGSARPGKGPAPLHKGLRPTAPRRFP